LRANHLLLATPNRNTKIELGVGLIRHKNAPPKAVKDRDRNAPIVENNAVEPGAKHAVWKTQSPEHCRTVKYHSCMQKADTLCKIPNGKSANGRQKIVRSVEQPDKNSPAAKSPPVNGKKTFCQPFAHTHQNSHKQ